MPRINELVRIATLGRHFEQGLVASVEIIDDGERWSVCVHYNERAEGPKTRFLTSQRKPGPKQYASLLYCLEGTNRTWGNTGDDKTNTTRK